MGLKIPKFLWNKLKLHQKAGVKWLWSRALGNTGGILGDEMGLGKTLQVITLCVGMHYANYSDPVLIIVPCTLQRQWEQEFKQWWPLLNVKHLADINKIRSNTIYITGYDRARIKGEQIIDQPWRLVICDEGQ